MVKSVKIGPVAFKVVEKNKLRSRNAQGQRIRLNGRIRYQRSLIQIDAKMSPTAQVATVWHEIIHGVLEKAGIDEHPEPLVIALGYGLLEVIQDNPELVEWTRSVRCQAKPTSN